MADHKIRHAVLRDMALHLPGGRPGTASPRSRRPINRQVFKAITFFLPLYHNTKFPIGAGTWTNFKSTCPIILVQLHGQGRRADGVAVQPSSQQTAGGIMKRTCHWQHNVKELILCRPSTRKNIKALALRLLTAAKSEVIHKKRWRRRFIKAPISWRRSRVPELQKGSPSRRYSKLPKFWKSLRPNSSKMIHPIHDAGMRSAKAFIPVYPK